MYDQSRQKEPNIAVASLLNPRSSPMDRFEGITTVNIHLIGNRLGANIGGKYWQKTIPKMANLASFHID